MKAGAPARAKIDDKILEPMMAGAREAEVSGALRDRLQHALLWLRTAKENLPDLNNGQIPADRIAAASGLIDRLHRLALSAAAEGTARGRRQHRAA